MNPVVPRVLLVNAAHIDRDRTSALRLDGGVPSVRSRMLVGVASLAGRATATMRLRFSPALEEPRERKEKSARRVWLVVVREAETLALRTHFGADWAPPAGAFAAEVSKASAARGKCFSAGSSRSNRGHKIRRRRTAPALLSSHVIGVGAPASPRVSAVAF